MKLSHRICIADTCGRQFDTRIPETRTGLRSFWKHYCPQCRTKGNVINFPQTMNAKHTPDIAITHSKTPWGVEKGIWANEGQIFIEGEESGNTHKQHIAKLGYAYDKQGQDQRDANAAFIVRACNSHEALVGALNTLLAIIHQQSSCTDTQFDNGIEKAYAALTLATIRLCL